MPYRILVPRNYDAAKRYPLHVFLHGIGERGNDNEKQLGLGAKFFQEDSIRSAYPAFVVFPQCPEAYYWSSDEALVTLKGLIDNLSAAYSVDAARISISGFSMGAYGTFAMVARYPLFESAIAISGDGEKGKAKVMSAAKWRIFAGKKDQVVPSAESESMALALRNAGASVSFTLYPEADHTNIWISAFTEPDFFYWLFSSGHADGKNY